MPSYSIVIPFYAQTIKQVLQLKECLTHLQKCDGIEEVEMMVVDDASPMPPSIIENAIKHFNVRYLRLLKNSGPGVARNEGAKESLGHILLFMDHDCLPPSQWLKILTAPILENKCQATTATYVGSANQKWLTNYQFYDFEYRTLSKERLVDFLHGCSCAVERSAFFKSGGFPEVRCYEDQLFGKRLVQNGNKVLYLPLGGVVHHFRSNLKEYLKQQFRFGESIAYYSLLMNFSLKKILLKFKKREKEYYRKSFVSTQWTIALTFMVYLSLTLFFLSPFDSLIYLKIALILIGMILLAHIHFIILLFKKKKSFWTVISYFPLMILLQSVYLCAVLSAIAKICLSRIQNSFLGIEL